MHMLISHYFANKRFSWASSAFFHSPVSTLPTLTDGYSLGIISLGQGSVGNRLSKVANKASGAVVRLRAVSKKKKHLAAGRGCGIVGLAGLQVPG